MKCLHNFETLMVQITEKCYNFIGPFVLQWYSDGTDLLHVVAMIVW
jgi:hypothetical protein